MKTPARPFLWRTQDGQSYTPAQMRTSHLFYTVRMIFNHTAPACYRIPGCKRYALKMEPEYLRAAVLAMVNELKERPCQDLTAGQWEELLHIATVSRELYDSRLN